MSKQFRVTIDGGDPLIIDIKDNESIGINVESVASKFFDAGESTLGARISGMRWADDGYFTFEWNRVELSLNSDVRITEKVCSFCQRPASEVQHLIDGGLLAKICDVCVAECQHLIDEKRAI